MEKTAFWWKVLFRPHWWDEKFLRKKIGCRIRKIFEPNNDVFPQFLDPHGFRAEGPKKKIGPFSKKKLYDLGFSWGGANRKGFFGKGPKNVFMPSALKPWGSVQKLEKNHFLAKKMWKISNLASFFSSKNFQPTNATEKALCTKQLVFTGNWVTKTKQNWKK